MTISVINLGSIPLGTGGDTARLAFTKVNDNFASLDSRITGNTTDIATNASDIILNASNIAAANAAAAAAQTSADTAAAAATNANTNANTRVLKAGDTMTGLLTLSGAPTANLHAATKLYVDTASNFSAGTGLSLTGKVFANTGVLSFNTRVGAVTLSSADVTTALTFTPYNATNPAGYISGITSGNVTTALGFTPENAANKGIASGYASLDSGGKIPSGQLPSIAVTDTFVIASQAAMLALTAQTGDVAIRTDLSKSFILQVNDPTTLANWAELLSPSGAVTSITGTANQVIASGPTGAVILSLPQNIHMAATPTFGSLTLGTGNLNFTTTGQRITGDFSNATVANRLLFQTSTANGATDLVAMPKGTGTISSLTTLNTSDPLNSSFVDLGINSTLAFISTYAQGSGASLPFAIFNAGAERLRIDTSGRLGISVVPSAWGTPSIDMGELGLNFFAGNTVFASNLYYDGTNWRTKVTASGGIIDIIRDNTVFFRSASVTAGGVATLIESMRIDSAGTVLIGKNAPSSTSVGNMLALSTSGYNESVSTDASTGVPLWQMNRQASTGTVISFRQANTTVGAVNITNSATSYNTSSDYRLKNITGPLLTSGAFIDSLKPKVGTWKIDGSKFVGFLAHEFQETSPSSVIGEKDAVDAEDNPVMQAMEYGSAETIANIVAELQSLRKRVAALENKQ